MATDGRATARPGPSGAADSGPPGWASAEQARSWCHAANLASRLHSHDVSSAQLYLVLDGIFPHGWEHEEAMARLDSESTLLLELCYSSFARWDRLPRLSSAWPMASASPGEALLLNRPRTPGAFISEDRLKSELSRGAVSNSIRRSLWEKSPSGWLKRLATHLLRIWTVCARLIRYAVSNSIHTSLWEKSAGGWLKQLATDLLLIWTVCARNANSRPAAWELGRV